MPLIQEIWIINSAGVILFNLQLVGTPLHDQLLGGFIAAMENFCDNLDDVGKADVKSIVFSSTRFSLGRLGIGDLLIAVRTETATPEKKVNKTLRELREKLKKYVQKKGVATPQDRPLANFGFSLEFDDEINDIFFTCNNEKSV